MSDPDDAGEQPPTTAVTAEHLAMIEATRRHVGESTEPDPRVLFGIWGVAWLGGYSALFFGRGHADRPQAWAFGVFAALLAVAVVVTLVHVLLRVRGVSGVSARSGAMYGWTWFVGFSGIYLINVGLRNAGASEAVLDLAWNALPCLLVGLMYLAGGALWRETAIFVLGAWIVLVAGVATLVGLPTGYAVMAFAGGGGMLACAVVAAIARARRGGGAPGAGECR
ncbi:MAG: hypothetical protein ACTMIR_07725 [Cellulomonadaceae bacterium]